MQDAQLISQAGQVESLASDGLVSVSTGAGQPQKNMELAKFADSLGSSVPLQQTSEQVSITGLYARTSDGKMVELTKESVASVMAGLMGNPIGYRRLLTSVDDLNDIGDGIFYTSGVNDPANSPSGMYNNVIVQFSNPSAGHRFQTLYSSNGQVCMFRRFDTLGWTDWSRLDNFGYNSLAELSSGVAQQIGVKSLSGVITVNPGEKVKILPSYAFGLIVLNNTDNGKTSIIAADSQYILEAGILFNGIGVSEDLTAPSKLCVNREATNGEVYLKNNTSSVCNILARCVTA